MATPYLQYEDKCLHKRTLWSCILHICKGGNLKKKKKRKPTHFPFEDTEGAVYNSTQNDWEVPASKFKPQTTIPDRCYL